MKAAAAASNGDAEVTRGTGARGQGRQRGGWTVVGWDEGGMERRGSWGWRGRVVG